MGNKISRKEKDLTVLKVLKRQSKINWNSFHSLLFCTKHFVFIGKYLDWIMLYLFFIFIYNSLLLLLLLFSDELSKELNEDIFTMTPNKLRTSFMILICFSLMYISIRSKPISNMFLLSLSCSASKFFTDKFINIIVPIFSWFTMASWLLNKVIFDKNISEMTFIKFFLPSAEHLSYNMNMILI